jgi:hypothetical protein
MYPSTLQCLSICLYVITSELPQNNDGVEYDEFHYGYQYVPISVKSAQQ